MGLDRTGSQPPRPPLPSPRTASTQQEPPHRCPQLGLPHRRPREYRPHQGTPSSHPLSNSTHHPQPDMRGIDHADPLQHHHPYRAGLPRHPTQDTTTATRTTHQHAPGRDRPWATPTAATGPEDMRHTHPTTRSHRSPPERPTAHTQASTHTHGRQAVSGPHTHAQPHRRDHHHQPSHRQPPRHTQASHNHQDHEAPTQHELNHSSATSTQRSDQRKHQKSRHRNNHQPESLSPDTPGSDRPHTLPRPLRVNRPDNMRKFGT